MNWADWAFVLAALAIAYNIGYCRGLRRARAIYRTAMFPIGRRDG